MKVLVVAPQPFFTPRGTPFSVYYRTLVTAELGGEIDLLTYGEGRDCDIEGVRVHRIPRFRFLEPVPVGPSLRKAWLDLFIIVWTLALLLRRRYDFVHAHEEAVFFLRFLKPIFRFKLVYDMHSSLPQQLTNFSYTRSRILIGLFEALEKTCARTAEAVITISPALQSYAHTVVRDPARVVLIENSIFEDVRLRGGNGADATPEPTVTLPAGRPIVFYAGTFETYQGIDRLLEAHARVVAERPDAVLVLMGGAPRKIEAYRAQAAALGIEDACLFTGTVPRSVVRDTLPRATVTVSPRTIGDNTPLKIYELIAARVPLVATRILSHTQILDDETCILVEPDAAGLAEGILTVLRDPERSAAIAARARALYEAQYSREAYVRKMRDMLRLVGQCAE